jgi:predicted GIY-YIG superfamily endonuclease
MSKRTAVYRVFDAGGQLLYVGMTGNPTHRLTQHKAAGAQWYALADLTRTTVAWFDSRAEAAAAEVQSIGSEHPRFNKYGVLSPEGLAHLERAAANFRAARELRDGLDGELWELVQEARELGIPDTVICQRGDISRSTLQRRLGYRAEADD